MKTHAPRLLPALVACALSACSTTGIPPISEWKIEPVQAVKHGGDDGNTVAAANVSLARYHENRGETRQAIAAYRRALDADPGSATTWNALGILLARRGEQAEAIAAFNRAVDLAPSTSHLRNNLGYALLLAGHHDAAVNALQQAVSLDDKNARAWANLARVYRHLELSELAAQASYRARGGTPLAPQQAAVTNPVVQPVPPAPGAPTLAQVSTAPVTVELASEPRFVEAPRAPELVPVAPNVFELRNTPEATVVALAPATAPETARAAEAPPPLPDRPVRYQITNGQGGEGLARRLAAMLSKEGMSRPRLTNHTAFDQSETYIEYRNGFRDAAEAFAMRLPFRPAIQPSPSSANGSDVRLMLGKDLNTGEACAVLRLCTARPQG